MRPVTLLSSPGAMAPAQRHPSPQQHSAWRSPVPYLFGSLAAMMGLIVFALLLLACSYWKLSGYLEEGIGGGDGSDPESGGGKPEDASAKDPPRPLEQRIVVIMAGEDKPTYIATPVSSRASSFANRGNGGEEEGKTERENKPDGRLEGADDGGRPQEGMQENEGATQQNHEEHQNGEGSHRRCLERDQ